MQLSRLSIHVLFFALVALFANAAVLEARQSPYVCDVVGSAGSCNSNDAGQCIQALKGQFRRRSDGKLEFSHNYGAYVGGCRCYAQCRTGPDYPTCVVESGRVDQHLYGLRDHCISSAAHAIGHIYADNVKWEFARF